MEKSFSEFNIDPILGAEVMRTLELSFDDLQIPQKFERVKDVMEFLSKYPGDKLALIRKPIIGKGIDKLNHIWGMTELYKRKMAKEAELKKLDEELSYY